MLAALGAEEGAAGGDPGRSWLEGTQNTRAELTSAVCFRCSLDQGAELGEILSVNEVVLEASLKQIIPRMDKTIKCQFNPPTFSHVCF